jgi:hypothetical protein
MTEIRRALKFNYKITPINNVICIFNGIFHGICCVLKLENSDAMKKLTLA